MHTTSSLRTVAYRRLGLLTVERATRLLRRLFLFLDVYRRKRLIGATQPAEGGNRERHALQLEFAPQ